MMIEAIISKWGVVNQTATRTKMARKTAAVCRINAIVKSPQYVVSVLFQLITRCLLSNKFGQLT